MKVFFKKQYIFPLVYLILVVVCILMAFDYKGSLNSDWWLALCALTLPWSLVSIIFMWALYHGAGLGFFTVMYLAFAIINAFLIYLIARPKNKIENLS